MLFKIRIKQCSENLDVYQVNVENGVVKFLVYAAGDQTWAYVLADNCVPAL